jgi:hypothetical protein
LVPDYVRYILHIYIYRTTICPRAVKEGIFLVNIDSFNAIQIKHLTKNTPLVKNEFYVTVDRRLNSKSVPVRNEGTGSDSPRMYGAVTADTKSSTISPQGNMMSHKMTHWPSTGGVTLWCVSHFMWYCTLL